MKFTRHFIFVVSLLFCTAYCTAQSKEYIYEDSSIVYPQQDTLIPAAPDEAATDEEVQDENYTSQPVIDTMLYHNGHLLSPDSVRALKNDKAFAYAKNLDSLLNALQHKKEKKQDDADVPWILHFLASPLTKYFFWLLAGLFILFILYRLFFADGFFRGTSTRMQSAIVQDEEELKNIDFNKKIKEAAAEKNYRLAVRWLYLQTLHELNAAGNIIYGADKTNRQYYYELGGKPYQHEFGQLCSHYEYVWYGEFETDETVFSKIKNGFTQFNGRIKS